MKYCIRKERKNEMYLLKRILVMNIYTMTGNAVTGQYVFIRS